MKLYHAFSVALMIGAPLLGVSSASAEGNQLFAVLSGGNEVSNPGGAANAGDPNGFGSATVIFSGPELSTVCIGVVVDDINKPTLMHIHEGDAGTNGDVVITFNPPTQGNPGQRAQCVTEVDPALSQEIRENPSHFYVNIHNGPFGGGAVRGQLF